MLPGPARCATVGTGGAARAAILPRMRLRGLICDMDGVLCDSEPFILEAAQAMFRRVHCVEVPDRDFLDFVGTGEDSYLAGPGQRHGVTVRLPEDKVETYRIYLELIKGRLRPLPGVPDVLRAVKAAGLQVAVASAADLMKVEGNLTEIGLPLSFFDAVVTGSEVERKKPAPDCFLLAAARLGLPPGDCVVAEDAVNGIRAAAAAGCHRLGLTTSFPAARLVEAGAEWTAPHLGALPEAVRVAVGV